MEYRAWKNVGFGAGLGSSVAIEEGGVVGDNLEDFMAGSKSAPELRREMAVPYGGRWGREWIILPNPMYGSWTTVE